MRKRLTYALALITPVIGWSLLFFLAYAGFSGKVHFYNDLPGYAKVCLRWSLPAIAALGVVVDVDVDVFKQNQWSTKSIALFYFRLY